VQGVEVTLPGGLVKNGGIERQARFRLFNGKIEQELIEFEMGLDQPGYVTRVLGSTLESIGNQPVDETQVADLCVADRQYLMLRLAAMLDGEQMWLKVDCLHCESLFDVNLRRCELPLKKAGQDFPLVAIQLPEFALNVRVPTGSDQERIVELSEEQSMKTLLQSCILSVNGEPPGKTFVDSLSESDIDAIDVALDETSPAVCTELLVKCPECGKEQVAELNHYHLTGLDGSAFYDKVHTLALHYNWSEAEILNLPQSRRNRYLELINRSNTMSAQV
jgi:hypothetical protein